MFKNLTQGDGSLVFLQSNRINLTQENRPPVFWKGIMSFLATLFKNKINENSALVYSAANLQSQGARAEQQDSFAVLNSKDSDRAKKEGLFAVVCDGMGGMENGAEISELAVSLYIQAFKNIDTTKDISAQLLSFTQSINSEIYSKYCGLGGTTLALVFIFEEQLYWLCVGDSAIFLKRKELLCELNLQDTYANALLYKMIKGDNACTSEIPEKEDGARLTQFIGQNTDTTPDRNHKPFMLQEGDGILLCTDGIFGSIDEQAISKALCYPPEVCARQLNSLVAYSNKQHQDNFTAVIISCTK